MQDPWKEILLFMLLSENPNLYMLLKAVSTKQQIQIVFKAITGMLLNTHVICSG